VPPGDSLAFNTLSPTGRSSLMAKKTADEVMTIIDLAVYLKLSKSTLYKLCQEGKVPGQKIGKHWRFHREVIDRWLGRKKEGTARHT